MKRDGMIVITGPTATGKSALAVEIALWCENTLGISCEIISADSRQVYQGLDIGSAKITTAEMRGIPHHLIDVAPLSEIFTVAHFQTLAREAIQSIQARHHLPILCGGTGMYLSAVIDHHDFPQVPPDRVFREQLEKFSCDELFAQLQHIDPLRASHIDAHNPRRLIRALEIAHFQSQSTPEIKPLGDGTPLIRENPAVLMIGLTLPKEELQKRIALRIEERIPALFHEITRLHDEGVSFERLTSLGLEYRYGSAYVQHQMDLQLFQETLATKTWQFVKRQMTWLKRDERIHWLNPLLYQEKILKLVQDFLEE